MISKRELGEIALKSTNFKNFYERLLKEYSLPKQKNSLKSSLKGFYCKFLMLRENSNRKKNLERKHISLYICTHIYIYTYHFEDYVMYRK